MGGSRFLGEKQVDKEKASKMFL